MCQLFYERDRMNRYQYFLLNFQILVLVLYLYIKKSTSIILKIIIYFSQNKEDHMSIKTYHLLNKISAKMDLLLKSTIDTCTMNDKWHDNCIKLIK